MLTDVVISHTFALLILQQCSFLTLKYVEEKCISKGCQGGNSRQSRLIHFGLLMGNVNNQLLLSNIT